MVGKYVFTVDIAGRCQKSFVLASKQGMENKTRRNFAFLPVSQVRTNTCFYCPFP